MLYYILFCIIYNTKLLGFLHAVIRNVLRAGYVCLSVRYSVSPSKLLETPFEVAFKKLREATISLTMPVCPSVRMEQRESHWTKSRQI
jgi:hypothetical protein